MIEKFNKERATEKINISILIPARNEEENIVNCIRSVAWSNDIVVLDSLSEDLTKVLAEKNGATVVSRKYDNHSAHANWGLNNIEFRNDYVMLIDADMRVSDSLKQELFEEMAKDMPADGYYIPIHNYFNGKWIKHGGWYPNYHLMLYRHKKARFERRLVHAHVILEGNKTYMNSPVLHMDDRGIEHFINRHNIYSSLEAIEAFKKINKIDSKVNSDIGLQRSRNTRRTMKEFAYKYVLGRPLVKFLWQYVIQLGFLDGRIGFRYCVLHAFYEYMITLKLLEIKEGNSAFYKQYGHYLEDDAINQRER